MMKHILEHPLFLKPTGKALDFLPLNWSSNLVPCTFLFVFTNIYNLFGEKALFI